MNNIFDDLKILKNRNKKGDKKYGRLELDEAYGWLPSRDNL